MASMTLDGRTQKVQKHSEDAFEPLVIPSILLHICTQQVVWRLSLIQSHAKGGGSDVASVCSPSSYRQNNNVFQCLGREDTGDVRNACP